MEICKETYTGTILFSSVKINLAVKFCVKFCVKGSKYCASVFSISHIYIYIYKG